MFVNEANSDPRGWHCVIVVCLEERWTMSLYSCVLTRSKDSGRTDRKCCANQSIIGCEVFLNWKENTHPKQFVFFKVLSCRNSILLIVPIRSHPRHSCFTKALRFLDGCLHATSLYTDLHWKTNIFTQTIPCLWNLFLVQSIAYILSLQSVQ